MQEDLLKIHERDVSLLKASFDDLAKQMHMYYESNLKEMQRHHQIVRQALFCYLLFFVARHANNESIDVHEKHDFDVTSFPLFRK